MDEPEESASVDDRDTIKVESAARAASLDLPLTRASQACTECRRRKAKCDRVVPTCGLCSKYGIRCLYERQYRTPLTRKRLTDLEERLAKAERLLKQARLNSLLPANVDAQLDDFGWPNPENLGRASMSTTQDQYFTGYGSDTFPSDAPLGQVHFTSGRNILQSAALDDTSHASDTLDGPPHVSDDFEWNEQHMVEGRNSESGLSPEKSNTSEDVEEESIAMDGMASLTIGDSEGGYLGASSGAAMLRLIDPRAANASTPRKKSSRVPSDRVSRGDETWPEVLYEQPDPNRHIVDTMIDAYFGLYHISFPIVHEPTFRAQYSELIERPNGDCWKFLAYVVAAVGVFTTTSAGDDSDMALFAHAKSLMHLSYLESGNLTLIQALGLMSNYLQRKDMPNSGYNYLGLASRMAMGLGLHKEFPGWKIQPLKMEIRRRVWWCLAIFDIGATITYGRPVSWPAGGIDVSLPLNIDDRLLTAASKQYPPSSQEFTIYTTVRALSSFCLSILPIYARIISKPFPSAEELMNLDDRLIAEWHSNLPSFFKEDSHVAPKYRTSHAIVMWKCQNFRTIMYRPFVIRQLLQNQQDRRQPSLQECQAYDRCLYETRSTILSVQEFWNHGEHTRLGAWYALYFLFQAALIPCICLRHESALGAASQNSGDWLHQIRITLEITKSISTVHPAAEKCYDVIQRLCEQYLSKGSSPSAAPEQSSGPMNASPHTQMNSVYSMMWSHAPAFDEDLTMQDDAWMAFLAEENQNIHI